MSFTFSELSCEYNTVVKLPKKFTKGSKGFAFQDQHVLIHSFLIQNTLEIIGECRFPSSELSSSIKSVDHYQEDPELRQFVY